MTDLDIFNAFRNNPIANPSKLDIHWFNRITNELTATPEYRIQLITGQPHMRTIGGLREWKEPYNITGVVADRVTRVTLNNLYVTALMTLPNKFNVSNFPALVSRLYKLHKQAKVLREERNVVEGLKVYLNAIFGMMSNGVIQHETATSDTIVRICREQVGAVYAHPNAFHVNTDEVYFVWTSDEDILGWVNEHVDPRFAVELEHLASVERGEHSRAIIRS